MSQKDIMRNSSAALICVSLLLTAQPAFAQVTTQDLQVAGRALSFLEKPLTGEISVGIVYARDDPQSAQEAASVQKLLGGGLKIGNSTLKPLLVTVSDAVRADVDLYFLTPGLGADASALAQASKAKHVPCITTDIAQVRSGRCALGVRSRPKVEIVVNRAAAAGSGMSFSTVFRMMITEL